MEKSLRTGEFFVKLLTFLSKNLYIMNYSCQWRCGLDAGQTTLPLTAIFHYLATVSRLFLLAMRLIAHRSPQYELSRIKYFRKEYKQAGPIQKKLSDA